MTKFNLSDHNKAMAAYWDAKDFGATVDSEDMWTLNEVASTYMCCEPSHGTTRSEFKEALARVYSAIDAAKIADPERVSRVMREREEMEAKSRVASR